MTTPLPVANLIIAGVTKAGTTSLFEYLGQHPYVLPASLKQTNYFRPAREPGGQLEPLEHYAAYFAGGESHRYRLEASPSYFYGGPHLVRSIDEVLPEPRVIISLREPVSRFWSHYKMKSRDQPMVGSRPQRPVEQGSGVHEYVAKTVAAVRHGEASPWEHPGVGPVAVGLYGDFVGQWIEVFGDRLRFVFFDDLQADPASVVADLYGWLGLDPAFAASVSYAVRNRGVVRRSRRLGRVAQRVGRAGAPLLQHQPKVKGWLRAAHDAINGSIDRAGTLDEASATLLRELYRPSNCQVAAALQANGYTNLPSWLGKRADDVG